MLFNVPSSQETSANSSFFLNFDSSGTVYMWSSCGGVRVGFGGATSSSVGSGFTGTSASRSSDIASSVSRGATSSSSTGTCACTFTSSSSSSSSLREVSRYYSFFRTYHVRSLNVFQLQLIVLILKVSDASPVISSFLLRIRQLLRYLHLSRHKVQKPMY